MTLPNDVLWSEDNTLYARGAVQNQFFPYNVHWLADGYQIEANIKEGIYYSGQMTTKSKWSFLYGYAEIRARIPSGKGCWSSFYLAGDAWPPEVDVFENLGSGVFYLTTHGSSTERVQAVLGFPNMAADYHTYAVDWDKDRLIWVFDGKEVFRSTKYIPQVPMSLYLMFAVGGWPGAPDITTVFPAYYDIDYVRVWQRK